MSGISRIDIKTTEVKTTENKIYYIVKLEGEKAPINDLDNKIRGLGFEKLTESRSEPEGSLSVSYKVLYGGGVEEIKDLVRVKQESALPPEKSGSSVGESDATESPTGSSGNLKADETEASTFVVVDKVKPDPMVKDLWSLLSFFLESPTQTGSIELSVALEAFEKNFPSKKLSKLIDNSKKLKPETLKEWGINILEEFLKSCDKNPQLRPLFTRTDIFDEASVQKVRDLVQGYQKEIVLGVFRFKSLIKLLDVLK